MSFWICSPLGKLFLSFHLVLVMTSRFVASKVATNGDARGDRTAGEAFVHNGMLPPFDPSYFVCLGTQTLVSVATEI